jgi:ubiquinone/menaquinone biosynthesis C-methylase UbiE
MPEKPLEHDSSENLRASQAIGYQGERNRIASILTPLAYDGIAHQFMDLQEEFYKDHAHESGSRKVLYEALGDVTGKIVLDAGCGYGRDANYYQNKGAIVHGIDASEEMVRLAHEKYPHLISVSQQLLERTDYPDGYFDAIMSRYAIQHALHISAVYAEWHRILKQGGIASFVATHPDVQAQLPADERGIVQVPLFDGKCLVPEPAHKLKDYFPPELFEMFDLVAFHEKEGQQNIHAGKNVPDFFFMKLRKK